MASRYKAAVGKASLSVRQAFDPVFKNAAAEELADDICGYLEMAIQEKQFVFIFDQIERYLQLLASSAKHPSSNISGFDAYLFIRTIQRLKAFPNVRTLFVIRAETFYNVFEFLVLIAARDAKQDAGNVSTFLCPGINAQSAPEAMRGIRDDFNKIPNAENYLQEFEFITGLYNRELSNTFMIQLVGFVVEHFFGVDSRVKDMLKETKDRTVAIRLTFDLLFHEFSSEGHSSESLELLKAIIFSVAIENRVTGQAVSLARISSLTHIPPSEVEVGVEFFRRRGLLKADLRSEFPCFRIVHDVIGDHVVESEQFAIDANLRDGIRGLSEARIPTSEMTEVKRYAGLFSDLTQNWNIGLFSIWLFIVFGVAKLLVAPFCDMSYRVLHYIPQSLSCSVVNRSYGTTLIMHVLWLSFIYNIDQNYFAHVFKSKRMKLVSMSMAVVGAGLAILLSLKSGTAVTSLVAGGLMMSVLLIVGSCNDTFVGRESQINRSWGELTLWNMCFTASLTIPVLLVLWPNAVARQFWGQVSVSLSAMVSNLIEFQADGIGVASVIFLAGLMIYFWYHIRPTQQSRIALASRLALHDRSQDQTFMNVIDNLDARGLLLQRGKEATVRGRRNDSFHLALVLEGGGMRNRFDRYGVCVRGRGPAKCLRFGPWLKRGCVRSSILFDWSISSWRQYLLRRYKQSHIH